MPVVEITYAGLIRAAVTCRSENYELVENATLGDLLTAVVQRHGPDTRDYLFDDSFKLVSGVAVLMGGIAARDLNARVGDEELVQVVVMSPMMIGG